MTIEFAVRDVSTIENYVITAYEALAKRSLADGDPIRIFLQAMASVIAQQRVLIDYAAKQNLVAYAEGEYLDALGERTDCTRLAATAATTTLRFTLSDAQASAITIPAGTRATPDSKLFFATIGDLVISAGSLYGDVTARAAGTGEGYNGYLAGQINQLVDAVAYVASVANTTTSSGGDEEEPDDNYRERIRQSPTAFSTAGPTDAYIYWAKTADEDIADVVVTSPSDGEILITALMKNGAAPSSSVLAAVETICSAVKRRPLTDHITAAARSTVTYNTVLTYYIDKVNSASESAIRASIEGTNGAVAQYQAWQCAKMGRDINPDHLRQLMLNAGASRMVMTSPEYTAVADTVVALAGTTTITYGGLE